MLLNNTFYILYVAYILRWASLGSGTLEVVESKVTHFGVLLKIGGGASSLFYRVER